MFEMIMLLAFAYAGFARLLPAGRPAMHDRLQRKVSPRHAASGAAGRTGRKEKDRSRVETKKRPKTNTAETEGINVSLFNPHYLESIR